MMKALSEMQEFDIFVCNGIEYCFIGKLLMRKFKDSYAVYNSFTDKTEWFDEDANNPQQYEMI